MLTQGLQRILARTGRRGGGAMLGRNSLEQLRASLLALGPRRLAALGAIGVAVAAAIALGSFLLSRPEFETLYAGLSPLEVTRIGAVLGEAGIAFDASGDKVLVPHGQAPGARALLAEKGLPGASGSGYELFDKLGPLGLTSFMQEVTRVRALEGELARTIQNMKGVRAARVHLVLPDAGAFRRARQPPSASVVIRTDVAGDASSAQAIRHLVAAAIPGMTVDQVRVLGTDGTVLSAGAEASGAIAGKLVDVERAVARELQDNVRRTLAPHLGLDNFEVSVAARLNVDKRQVNETAYDPDSKVERSRRVVKETGSSQNSAARTTVSVEQNVPTDQPSASGADQSKRANDRREELTNYEIGSRSVTTVSDGYKIDSLAVAIVVNRKRIAAALGDKPSPEAIDKQVAEIERLAGSAAGLDAKRGDRVTVAALDFADSPALADAGAMWPALFGLAGAFVKALTVLALAFVVIRFGLRPAGRALLALPAPAQQAEAGALASPASATPDQLALAGAGSPPSLVAGIAEKLERAPGKRLEQIVDLDADQAAAVLRQWLRTG
jgi:flagellar M-ring protein FliF